MSEFDLPYSLRFFIALALGFLLGLERETSSQNTKGRVFAGTRTYTLISVFGFGCAWLYSIGATVLLPAGLLTVAALALVGYLGKLKEGHVGWTSEVAAVLTFVVGGLCLLSEIWVPMAIGIVATFLLSEKSQLEAWVERLDKTEFLAVIKFLIVTVIILPVLPDQGYTEFEINPRRIWQIVVIVSAVGFAGYFLAKKLGQRVGLWLSGVLGGIVSSTAVSIAMGRVAQQSPQSANDALRASLLASSIMYVRVLTLIWFIRPEFVGPIWLKLCALTAVGTVLAFWVHPNGGKSQNETAGKLSNPFEIKPALIFASLFVLMTIVSRFVLTTYGETALAVLAFLSGVTDIDPFILSLVNQTPAFQQIVVTAILLSMCGNTIMKGLYFGTLSKETRLATFWRYGLWALLHVPIVVWW